MLTSTLVRTWTLTSNLLRPRELRLVHETWVLQEHPTAATMVGN